jgi:uncharacterized protein YjaZ
MIKSHLTTVNPDLVEKFVHFLCAEFSISPISLTIDKYDMDDGTKGMCIDETNDDFIILVKEANRDIVQILNTIAHEMVHVKQYMKENLGNLLDLHSDIPYNERWWEIEAYSMSALLLEKFVKVLYSD